VNIKKSAYEAITQRLENDLASINFKISENKWEIKKKVEAQAILKRQRGLLCDLIYSIKNQKEKIKE
jgi:hypothetical protein